MNCRAMLWIVALRYYFLPLPTVGEGWGEGALGMPSSASPYKGEGKKTITPAPADHSVNE